MAESEESSVLWCKRQAGSLMRLEIGLLKEIYRAKSEAVPHTTLVEKLTQAQAHVVAAMEALAEIEDELSGKQQK